MGLDTVELIIRVEKHFEIAIPNRDAERISTVQDFADFVFTLVTLNPTGQCKSQLLFYKLRKYLIDRHSLERDSIMPGSQLANLIDVTPEILAEIGEYLELQLPAIPLSDSKPAKMKQVRLFGFIFWTGKAPLADVTLGELVRWTLALNHEKLIDPKNLCCKEDVEGIIAGIVSDSSGYPIHELKMQHSITSDLGMD
jgi:hypothetical protein